MVGIGGTSSAQQAAGVTGHSVNARLWRHERTLQNAPARYLVTSRSSDRDQQWTALLAAARRRRWWLQPLDVYQLGTALQQRSRCRRRSSGKSYPKAETSVSTSSSYCPRQGFEAFSPSAL